MTTISWADHVGNEQVLYGVRETENIHTIKRRKANLIGHIFCKNCLLKHITEVKIEGEVEVMGRKEKDVSSCWKTLRNERIMESEREGTTPHSVENPLWKRLRTCHMTD
jgi:hypothetical protein